MITKAGCLPAQEARMLAWLSAAQQHEINPQRYFLDSCIETRRRIDAGHSSPKGMPTPLLPFAVFYKYIDDFLAAVKPPPPQKKLKSLLNPDLVDPYKRKYATWAEMEQVDDGGAAALKFGDQRAFDLFVEKRRYVSLIQSFF